MLKVRCLQKAYKNRVITGYLLENVVTKQRYEVTPAELKSKIRSRQVDVVNLTLTSDNRLVDTTEEAENIENTEDKTKRKIFEAYKNEDKNKLAYVAKKVNSKRVGKAVMLALMLGVMAGTTGCSSQSAQPAYGMEQSMLDIQSIKDKINSVKTFTIGMPITSAKANGETLVKFTKSSKTTSITTTDGQVLDSSTLCGSLLQAKWDITDADGNLKYTVAEETSLASLNGLAIVYNITDADGNTVGTLEKPTNVISHACTIKDINGNLMVNVKQATTVSGFTIEIEDGCTIDNESVLEMIVSYMLKQVERTASGVTIFDL
jgi:hypothetical protein